MANTIALAKNYTSILDEVYKNASVTAAVNDFVADFEKLCGEGATMLNCMKQEYIMISNEAINIAKEAYKIEAECITTLAEHLNEESFSKAFLTSLS